MNSASHIRSSNTSGAAFFLRDVSIAFDNIPVLKKISFALEKNEIHAIVGKNGAGKSTLMKILAGVYTANEGSISIFDTDVTAKSSVEVLQSGLAMVYQELSLIPSMTVTQNVFLSRHPYKQWGLLNDLKAQEQTRAILKTMGIDFIDPNALVEKLSVGEAQLVEIAKALSQDPKIIIFDEPTAALSKIETAQLFSTIRRLKSRGMSMIYITHYLEDVMSLCDKVSVLRDGMIVATEETSKTSIASVVGHMLGDEHVATRARDKQKNLEKKTPLVKAHKAVTRHVGPVSFHAYAGEVVGFAGLLGSGRTEILRMLYGLDLVTSGSIEMNGKLVHYKHAYDATKNGVALVPEERRKQGLVLDFSIEHNVSLSILHKLRQRLFINGKKRSKLARDAIQNFHIKAVDEQQKVRFLSGGNQQKVVFGKCLVSEPHILLLDDPTFGVDVHAKTEIMKVIEAYAAAGNVVFFVSSELSEIAAFCDRTYIVKKRQIVDEIENIDLSEKKLLEIVQ